MYNRNTYIMQLCDHLKKKNVVNMVQMIVMILHFYLTVCRSIDVRWVQQLSVNCTILHLQFSCTLVA